MPETKDKNFYTLAFYNLENLFDVVNNPETLDDDFTPDSEKHWTKKRLKKKVNKLGKIISKLGVDEVKHPPLLVGVAEVENKKVLEKLVQSKFLKNKNYQFIHYDSPDERGIDTALLYRKDYVTILDSHVYELDINNPEGEKDYTRDILYVKAIIQNQEVHILVNHWPSRRDGAEITSYKREAAAQRNIEIITPILETNPDARFVIMGDFNDDPKSKSIKLLSTDLLYNPMELLLTKYEGSLNYKGAWNLFDQILISKNFLQQYGNDFRFEKADIFNKRIVQEYSGEYRGNPFRTYVGRKYLGGYSDHFPVYSIFSIKK
jgi:predicted extracellular nuclease